MPGDTFEDVTKTAPERSLTVVLKKHSGRNAQGRITVRHRGGENKRRYRLIDFKRDKHGVVAKVAAGAYTQVLAKDGGYVTVGMASDEMRKVLDTCYAVIGQVGNPDHANVKLGKAGRKRHMGIRPTVRGSAMSPRDHPHGGGEGRSPVGMPGPKSPWGKPTRGFKTRRNKRTDRLIVRRRVSKRR